MQVVSSAAARGYLFWSRWFRWLPAKLMVLGQAIWMGLLDPDQLNEITLVGYLGQSGFESETFNLQLGLWPWETDAVRDHLAHCSSLLVAGAGGGREVIALAKKGFEVTAFDFSTDLVTACRRNVASAGCTAKVLQAPADGVPDGLGRYDGLVVGRGFYHHIPARNRRVAFLAACHQHLAAGAPVFMSDFFVRPADSVAHRRIVAVANLVRRLRKSPQRVELGDSLNFCMQHAFVRQEIESELADAGFSLQVYAASPFGHGSHLAHAVATVT